MHDELLQQIFSVYGPLGLGWVAAGLLWRRQNKLQDDMLETMRGLTEALTLLSAKIGGGAR